MAKLVIRQFDVYPNPTYANRTRTPFLVVLQSHYIEGLDTSVVAPLHAEDVERLGVLSIDVVIDYTASVLVLSELAFIPTSRLRGRVGSLVGYEDDIRRALDRLFTGF